MFSFTAIVLYALFLILGWVLGLASVHGRGRWRAEAERERARAEAAEARIEASNARIAELERHAPAVGADTAASVGAAARGGRDDLALIRGVGHEREVALNDAGYHRFGQVARMSDADVAALEGRLGLTPGTIEREGWREQADHLANGRHDEHRRRWL